MVYEPKFYRCAECGAILEAITPQCCDELYCCGHETQLMRANELSDLREKHMPIVTRCDKSLTVSVGGTLHPMSSEHSILWIEVKSKYRTRRVMLKKGDDPVVTFKIPINIPVKVYSYCNKHGLWKATA